MYKQCIQPYSFFVFTNAYYKLYNCGAFHIHLGSVKAKLPQTLNLNGEVVCV